MEFLLGFYLIWPVIGLIVYLAYVWQGPLLVIWLAAGAATIMLSPIPLPQLSNPVHLLIWGLGATVYVSLWFSFVKPLGEGKDKPGIARQMLVGESGRIIRVPDEAGGGKVRFPYPVQGAEEWMIIPLGKMELGDQVTVVDLIGKSLVVRKADASGHDDQR